MHMLVIAAKLTVSFTNNANFNACSSYNYASVYVYCVGSTRLSLWCKTTFYNLHLMHGFTASLQGDDINEVMKQTLGCFGCL